VAGVDEVDQIVCGLLASRKYRMVCESTIRRIAGEEWARRASLPVSSRRKLSDAGKATRARLHQIHGAYESGIGYEQAGLALQQAYAERTEASIRAASLRVLALHASTRERLPILEQFYREVFGHTGVPQVLLDLACGLNPLSLPWMGLAPGALYYAYDIDAQRVAFLQSYLCLAGVGGEARLQDILSEPPALQADVALLMKSSPCLERQQKNGTLVVLDAVNVRHVVVSFAVKSLGRRDKGMPENYARWFQALVAGRPWSVARIDLQGELVFVVDKAVGA
jgi:16S rRNA (guanine(1405)-N(7))-methyltransferase